MKLAILSVIKPRTAARIEVRFEKESVWLTLDQLEALFAVINPLYHAI